MTLQRLACLLSIVLLGQGSLWAKSRPDQLPPSVVAALRQAGIPTDALSVVIAPADQPQAPRLRHLADTPRQPASVIKLVTTFAGLDLLGPDFSWPTPVWLTGPIQQGVLRGDLVIQGQGDPSLVLERLWLLLHKVKGLGVQRIEGNIVLDNSAFELPAKDPAAFDGEPLRPYNAAPEALLINFRAFSLSFTPDTEAGVARVQMDPPLWGVRVPATVPLGDAASPCVDYRAALKADFSDPQQVRLAGTFAAACGEKVWPVAYPDPMSYSARAVEGLWRSLGGQLSGQVVAGRAPMAAPRFVLQSPPLAAVIRDINKFSNNVMAQQLFLTLGRAHAEAARPQSARRAGRQNPPTLDDASRPAASFERSRATLQRWWHQRIGSKDLPDIDNGSGLSRSSRISAHALAELLHQAYRSPYLAELMASLPITGVDGTLKRSQANTANAHLKTGSLRGVVSRAGYVHSDSGQTLCLVAIINHERAQAARPALDALVDWAAHSR
jgi:D-alanyl-D-alanine carboxypeptidase/D-alanyl-D-alanine-endopeptidase (penicillin-binding protein 4)